MQDHDFYDAFYRDDAPTNQTVRGTSLPRNRFEFGVNLAGTGLRVLDIGCGNGMVLWNLRERFRSLHGVEVSPIRASVAALATGNQGNILIAQAAFLPYMSGCFDVVIMVDTIEHVADVRASLAEVHRVLRPGGRLILSSPNIAFLPRRIQLLVGRFPSTSQPSEGLGGAKEGLIDGGHLHYLTYSMVNRLLKEAGFGNVHCSALGRWPRAMSAWSSLLSPSIAAVAER